MQAYEYRSAIGQDSHRFMTDAEIRENPDRPLKMAGIEIACGRPLSGNSDADVILHALTNALSGISGTNILGPRSDQLCLIENKTNSAVYLKEALSTLGRWQLRHISIAVECKTPKLLKWIQPMKVQLAYLTGLAESDIGLTATSGEGLTRFGQGKGIQAFCQVTVRQKEQDLI